MGMFDHIWFDENSASAPKCAEGHPVTYLQTKCLQNNMDVLYVVRGMLYIKKPSEHKVLGAYDRYDLSYNSEEVMLAKTDRAKRLRITAQIEAYNGCDKCKPVMILNPHGWAGMVEEKGVSIQFTLCFDDGILTNVIPSVESREQLREKLLKRGVEVLEDDNPIVVAHLMMQERERARDS